jgi:hypothetical protein
MSKELMQEAESAVHESVTTDRPFRFYDNRQKYLAFVNTCNEKWQVARRVIQELMHLRPEPPSLRIFDAGMGDGTVLSHTMRAVHQQFPTLPVYVVGKEISLEDIRLSLEKLPDRFVEHPASVFVFTNLYYAESPWLKPRNPDMLDQVNWHVVELEGTSAYEYGKQLGSMDEFLVDGWQVRASEKTGNPLYVKPSVLVMYRKDHKFLLDAVIPRHGEQRADFDLVIASQPWRARMDAEFKVKYVLAPLVRALRPTGRILGVHSIGGDPGLELIREIWPEEDPFQVNRHDILRELARQLGDGAAEYTIGSSPDERAIFQYRMHTLPDEIAESIGTSTLFAAWNAAIYVAQIEDHRLEVAMAASDYLEATARILHKHNGLWFNDEAFVVSRKDVAG